MNRKKAYPLYETTVFRDFRVMVEQSAENFPDRPAISYKLNPRDKETQSVTYLQAKNDIRDLGTEEIALGLRDKKVAIVGGASCGWVYTYFSLMAVGAVTVPLDKEMPAPDLAATIERASCYAIFYGAEIAANSRQMANMQQVYGVQTALADYAGETRLANCQTNNTIISEGAATRNEIQRGIQTLMDKLCDQELQAERRENANLRQELLYARGQAAQVTQTDNIIDGLYNRLSNCPVSSVPVYGKQPIFTCQNNGCGYAA